MGWQKLNPSEKDSKLSIPSDSLKGNVLNYELKWCGRSTLQEKVFPAIGKENYLRSYFLRLRHQSFTCCFSMNSFCNPWVLHTDKALGLSDFKPKPACRRGTSFSSAVAERYSFVGVRGVLLPIEGRDGGEYKEKKHASSEKSHLGPQKSSP